MDMEIIPLGDYYAWHCEWCDSRNLTLWRKFLEESIICGACHKTFPSPAMGAEGSGSLLMGGL